MAGYNYQKGKSNNAVAAERRGLMTATQAAKAFGVEAKAISSLISSSEWHHSSSFYNEVNYYDPEDIEENIKELRELSKKIKSERANTYCGVGSAKYLEWSGTRKRPHAEEVDLDDARIEIKGDSVFINGTLKRLSTRGLSVTVTSLREGDELPEEVLNEFVKNIENHGRLSGSASFKGVRFEEATFEDYVKHSKDPWLKGLVKIAKEGKKVAAKAMKEEENLLNKRFDELIAGKSNYITQIKYSKDARDMQKIGNRELKTLFLKLKYYQKITFFKKISDGEDYITIGYECNKIWFVGSDVIEEIKTGAECDKKFAQLIKGKKDGFLLIHQTIENGKYKFVDEIISKSELKLLWNKLLYPDKESFFNDFETQPENLAIKLEGFESRRTYLLRDGILGKKQIAPTKNANNEIIFLANQEVAA